MEFHGDSCSTRRKERGRDGGVDASTAGEALKDANKERRKKRKEKELLYFFSTIPNIFFYCLGAFVVVVVLLQWIKKRFVSKRSQFFSGFAYL